MAVTLPRLKTALDLERLSVAGERYELINGELVAMPPAGDDHGFTGMDLAGEVSVFARRRKLGRCSLADTGFLLAQNPDTVLAPDLAFTRTERLPAKHLPGWATVVPDLVLEVRSPGTSIRESREKMELWLSFGVKVGWELDPPRRTLTIYRPEQAPVTLGENDTLTCEELLPGFSLALRDLFTY
jgi:Uma2 family endonuclease